MCDLQLDDWVLCRIFKKSGPASTSEDGMFQSVNASIQSNTIEKPSDYSNFFAGSPMSISPMANEAIFQAKEWHESMNPSSSSSSDQRNISYISLLSQQYHPQTIFHQNSLVNSAGDDDDAALQQSYQLPSNSQFQ